MQTILVVDDAKSIREFCKAELEGEGYRVFLARDGQEAFELLSLRCVDVVVLDLRMPHMNGLELLGRIKAIDRGLPVIFYTAHYQDYVHDHRSSPAFACVEKSEDLTELKLAIALALARAKAGAAGENAYCQSNIQEKNMHAREPTDSITESSAPSPFSEVWHLAFRV